MIKNFEGDFGKSLIYNFTIDYPLTYEELNNSEKIAVYPNPANDHFVIEGKNMEKSQIKIYNQVGQQLTLPETRKENKINFNSRSLIAGFYFIVIQDEHNKTYTRKLLIE